MKLPHERYSCSTKFVNKLDGGLNAKSGEGKNTGEEFISEYITAPSLVGGGMCIMNSSATLPDMSLIKCWITDN